MKLGHTYFIWSQNTNSGVETKVQGGIHVFKTFYFIKHLKTKKAAELDNKLIRGEWILWLGMWVCGKSAKTCVTHTRSDFVLAGTKMVLRLHWKWALSPDGGRGGGSPIYWHMGMCHCSGYGFQTIQSRTGCINHRNFGSEQLGIKFCNFYKLFSTGCNNSSQMRIGLIGFWCMWRSSWFTGLTCLEQVIKIKPLLV